MTDVTAQATFCATLVDEWVRAGVTRRGHRSRFALDAARAGADARPEMRVHVFHDERAAAFCALGIGLASGRPAVVLTTSGTAATHLHAAVVEADLACVPLLVCTADRPPELRDVGAPQTIDQTHLYGRAVRWFFDPGVADDAMRTSWRSIAAARARRPRPIRRARCISTCRSAIRSWGSRAPARRSDRRRTLDDPRASTPDVRSTRRLVARW